MLIFELFYFLHFTNAQKSHTYVLGKLIIEKMENMPEKVVKKSSSILKLTL
jgi:hypothetical protein